MASFFPSCVTPYPEKGACCSYPDPATRVFRAICKPHSCTIWQSWPKKSCGIAIDGVKFDVCKPGTNEKQSVFYNGWTHGHYISNVFVFAPNGTIVAMVINAPGALHDSTLMEMGKLYDKMEYG